MSVIQQDAAAMRLDQAAADGQAHAGAAIGAAGGEEGIEDTVAISGRNAGPVIGQGQARAVAVSCIRVAPAAAALLIR